MKFNKLKIRFFKNALYLLGAQLKVTLLKQQLLKQQERGDSIKLVKIFNGYEKGTN